MIHYLHGLFDLPSCWDYFRDEGIDSVAHNLYELDEEKMKQLVLKPEDILVGYSLGGRVALKLAELNNYQVKKIILISSHLGLSADEKNQRILWEEDIIQKLSQMKRHDFFSFWNKLSIFDPSSSYIPGDNASYAKSADLFKRHRLSQQKNYITDLLKMPEKIRYIFGYRDLKYSDLGWRLAQMGFKTQGISACHRVLLSQEELKKILKKETA